MSKIRPSRLERKPYTDALLEAWSEGRLPEDLYEQRTARAETAPSFDELDKLIADLPYDPETLRPESPEAAKAKKTARGRRKRTTMRIVGLAAACVVGFSLAGWVTTTAESARGANAAANDSEFSTAAGKKVKAPDTVPELTSDYARIKPVQADTLKQAVRFVDQHNLGRPTKFTAFDDSTEVTVTRPDKSVKVYRLAQDTAPVVDSQEMTQHPLADMKAAARVKADEVLKKARDDLHNDSEFNSIGISSESGFTKSRDYTDVMIVTFSDTNESGQQSIVYRLKDMKILDRI